MAEEGARPQRRGNAVNLKNCRKQGEHKHFDAEIRVSNVTALRFKNSFARSSVEKKTEVAEGAGCKFIAMLTPLVCDCSFLAIVPPKTATGRGMLLLTDIRAIGS
ncbi:MAG TPA: hypothetical protein VFR06_07650 [Gallionellaceae bacterium]|nr:hypothetical protein [Gallionellaceae bacterium]